MEIVPSNVHGNGKDPYNMCDKKTRHPQDNTKIGALWARGTKNTAARYEVAVFNSVFKHSKGFIMTRFANNAEDYASATPYLPRICSRTRMDCFAPPP